MNYLHPEIVINFRLVLDALDAAPFYSARTRPPTRGVDALIKANRVGFAPEFICDAAKSHCAANTFAHKTISLKKFK